MEGISGCSQFPTQFVVVQCNVRQCKIRSNGRVVMAPGYGAGEMIMRPPCPIQDSSALINSVRRTTY